jgi:hypothetical protein
MKSHGETIGKIVDLVFQLVEQGKSKERERSRNAGCAMDFQCFVLDLFRFNLMEGGSP